MQRWNYFILLIVLLTGTLPGRIHSQISPSTADGRFAKVVENDGFRGMDTKILLDKGTVSEILNIKHSTPLTLSPMAPFGAIGVSTEGLELSDISYVGWKAAHFGILRAALPQHSPHAIALTFDLWNAFMDQPLTSGWISDVNTDRTLREEIALRLGPYQSYPALDIEALYGELAEVRNLFTDGISVPFNPALKSEVLAALRDPALGFDPNVTLCLRRSTNVAGGVDRVGASFYDSDPGCLAYSLGIFDQDGCGCDPNTIEPRTVFQAIRETFAGFYSNHAFLERRRHALDESQVGTALLVHPCFPAELEMAHGVALVDRGVTGINTVIKLVSQVSANSAMPLQDNTVGEEVSIQEDVLATVMPPQLDRPSSLVPPGGHVLTWIEDYEVLAGFLLSVSDEFALRTGKINYLLAMEYKKMTSGDPTGPADRLVVTQVYELPVPDDTPVTIPDPHLKARIEETLGFPDPTVSDMLGLMDLRCSRLDIMDITGLEWAKNLQSLTLRFNDLFSIDPLSQLRHLESLDVSQNRISDLSPLAGLTQLRALNLHGNKIRDVSPLAGLSQLEFLELRKNLISDISSLATMTSLRHLNLNEGENLTDISALAGLKNLETLTLSVNDICDISALAYLKRLRELELRKNNIRSLRPLIRLTQLKRLDLRYNPNLSHEAYSDHLHQIVRKNPGIDLNYIPNANRPRGVSASPGTYADKVVVNWEEVPQGPLYPSYYQITRTDSTGVSILLNDTWQTATTFVDSIALPGEVYSYRIQGAADDQGIFKTDVSVAVTGWRM